MLLIKTFIYKPLVIGVVLEYLTEQYKVPLHKD